MDNDLVPCAGCKQPRVLKLGDYCRECALEWPENSTYIIVSPNTIEKAIHDSGMTGEYLKAKSEKAFENYQTYVIYFKDGEWKEICISDFFHVPTAMKNLLAKGKK